MSEYQILAVFSAFAFLYSLVGAKLARTPINGALVYVAAGFLCGPSLLGLVDITVSEDNLKRLAEYTLALVLFTDSAEANLPVLRKYENLPARLLLIGLPLCIGLGFLMGRLVFPELPLYDVALLATLLAPTDAALARAVVTNKLVPASVRESLNAESGLNDGICVPVLLIVLEWARGVENSESTRLMIELPLQEIGLGLFVGFGFAFAASSLLRICNHDRLLDGDWMQVPVIALALLCFSAAQTISGSGFIACFVGGLTFNALTKEDGEDVLRAAEGAGDLMTLITWFVFGVAFIGQQIGQSDWQPILYAILSITVIRMLPVWLAVIGLGLPWETRLFLAWFGPRGLASIVFVVLALKGSSRGDVLLQSATWTILLSVILHGLSANPLSLVYARRMNGMYKQTIRD